MPETKSYESIAANVAAVRENMRQAAEAAGRDPQDITLVAATKVQTSDTIRNAIRAGITICGENRVQELSEKFEQGAYEGCPLHFIGHLQKNKVKYLVGKVQLIESVDCLELLETIDKRAKSMGLVQDVLLEVNIGGEEAKSGFAPGELAGCLPQMGQFSSIRVRGLMAIPPICEKTEEIRPYFRAMKQLFVDNGAKKYDNVSMDFLSMGMSADFETAIEEGANIVRVGTGIFGARHY